MRAILTSGKEVLSYVLFKYVSVSQVNVFRRTLIYMYILYDIINTYIIYTKDS